jgi:hypothetical protein
MLVVCDLLELGLEVGIHTQGESRGLGHVLLPCVREDNSCILFDVKRLAIISYLCDTVRAGVLGTPPARVSQPDARISDMNTLSRSERLAATGAAILFTGVTAFVLLEDVIRGAPLTVSHPLTAVAIVGSILGGLWSVRLLRGGQYQVGAMLVLLTIAATVYVGVSAAARNAAAVAARSDRHVAAAADVAAARTDHDALKRDAALECRKVGPQCQLKQKLVDAAWSHVMIMEARRDMIGAGTGYTHAAATFAALTGYEQGSVERWLTLVMPFLLVLVAELGCVTMWHLSLGQGGGPTGGQRETVLPPVPEVIEEEPNVIEWKSRFEAKNGRPPRLPELQAAFPDMSRTTLWRRAQAA